MTPVPFDLSVEATEAYLAGKMTAEQAGRVCAEWVRAYKSDELDDRTGGNIHSAIEDVFGLGDGCACTVAIACFESAGFVASNQLRISGAPEAEVTAAWREAEKAERNAQCQLIREMFEFRHNV